MEPQAQVSGVNKTREEAVKGIGLCAVFAVAWFSGATLFAEIKVTVDYNNNAAANKDYKFKRVPSPAKDDLGAQAKVAMVDGEIDNNGADLTALTDGRLPVEEDEPAANFFFNAGTNGGRFRMDLGREFEIAQVNTYSWHPNTRGPQVYKLYAATGTDAKFNPAPLTGIDPVTCGWTLVAVVDTRPAQGDGGGQYGVSITDAGGVIGKYRYLLFSCITNEVDDDYGNTFYSEIDVIGNK
jgi:hypothetical protein